MPFPKKDRELLLSAKGMGPQTLARLEQIGFSSFEDLADADARQLTHWIAEEINAPCWKNNPHALRAINAAIKIAQDNI